MNYIYKDITWSPNLELCGWLEYLNICLFRIFKYFEKEDWKNLAVFCKGIHHIEQGLDYKGSAYLYHFILSFFIHNN